MNYVENYVPGKSAANYLTEHYVKVKKHAKKLPNETKIQLLEHTLKPVEKVLKTQFGPAGRLVHGYTIKKVSDKIEAGKIFKDPKIDAGSANQRSELHVFCSQLKNNNSDIKQFWDEVKHENDVKEICSFFSGL